MYEMKVRIRFSDIGSDQKLRLYELPKYFQDNNAGKHQDTDPMTSDYRSFYAFRIGDHYIDCMDLADQIEIADTEPETQAADVAQEVESN